LRRPFREAGNAVSSWVTEWRYVMKEGRLSDGF